MATLDGILMELSDHTQNVNIAKDMIISNLHNEGHLDDETAKMYLNEYHLILIKKSWIKRVWSRLKSFGQDDGYHYEFVKFQNCSTQDKITLPHKEDVAEEVTEEKTEE